MANEKDRAAPPAPQPPVEGPTRQFSLKMSGWLASLGADLDAPADAPAAPLDELLTQEGAQGTGQVPPEEEISLEAMLFPSDPPPKP